jgi:hypothetical protein
MVMHDPYADPSMHTRATNPWSDVTTSRAREFLESSYQMKTASVSMIQERNAAFWDMVSQPGLEKEAQETLRGFLRGQLYEGSVLDVYQPPVPIKWTDLDRDEKSENVYKVEDREFISTPAIQLSLRGTPQFELVETDRYKLRLVQFSSPVWGLKEQEVKTMRQPIEEVLRTQISFHLRKKIDRAWIGFMRRALATTGTSQIANFTSLGLQSITPESITRMKNTLDRRGATDGKYLAAHTLVMCKSMLNHTYEWPQMQGAGGPASTPGVFMNADQKWMTDGWQVQQLSGLRVIATMKNDIFAHNEIWVLPDPQFLGHHYTMNDERFQIVREFDQIKLRGWLHWMYGIGNSYGVGSGLFQPS